MTPDKQAQKALRELRDSVLRDIEEREVDAVKDGLALYRSLVNDYLEHRQRYDLIPRPSVKETGFLGTGGFQEIEWIRQDYRQFLNRAFRCDNVDILIQALRFPYRVAQGAIGHGDLQLIKIFLFQLSSDPYLLTLEELEPGRPRTVAIDRLWRNPKELANFAIRSELEDTDDGNYVDYLTSISKGLLSYFSNLFKLSVDRRQFEDFKEFLQGFRKTFDDMTWWVPGYRDWKLHSRIEGYFEHHELPKSPAYYRAVQEFLDGIRSLKRLTLFGIYAWLLCQHQRGNMTADEVDNWSQGITGFGDLSSLLDLYSMALSHSNMSLLGWERWLMEEAPEGVATSVDFGPYIDQALLISASKLMEDEVPDFELPSPVESAKHIANLAASDSRLRRTADDIVDDFERFSALTGLTRKNFSDRMAHFFDEITEKFDASWTDLVQESELAGERVARFQESVLTGYEEAIELELLFQNADAIRIVDEGEDNYQQSSWIGYSLTLEKEFFIPESRTNLSYFGKDLGEKLKESEADRQLEALKQHVEEREPNGGIDELIAQTESSLVEMRDGGYTPIVILNNAWRVYSEMRRRGELQNVEAPKANVESYWSGRFQEADTYALRVGSEATIFLIDIARLGTWESFRPWHGGVQEGAVVIGDRIKYELSAISEELARRWIKENPDGVLQQDEDGTTEPTDEAVERLRQRVLLKMFTRVELEVRDAEAAVRIPVPPIEDENETE